MIQRHKTSLCAHKKRRTTTRRFTKRRLIQNSDSTKRRYDKTLTITKHRQLQNADFFPLSNRIRNLVLRKFCIYFLICAKTEPKLNDYNYICLIFNSLRTTTSLFIKESWHSFQ
jgi:hypothetical protein